MLTETLVIAKDKSLVLLDRSADGSSEFVALKLRDIPEIEEISRVECAVAQEFIDRAVDFVGARGGYDAYLRSRSLSILSAVGAADHVELADSVDAQKLAAGTSRSNVDFRRPGIFDPVQ